MYDSSFMDVSESECGLEKYAFYLLLTQTILLLLVELEDIFWEIFKD